MKNNFKSLLLGTSLSLIPTLTNAQCVATTDCATLGYTETSCPDGKGLRCPFGNTFACPTSEASFCSKYGFKHTCSGTGYVGGAGTACNNQYTSCTCSAGYEWKNEKCEKEEPKATLGTCTGYAKNCAIGQILNSDGTCTSDKVSGKSPLGVVVAIKDNCGYAITIKAVAQNVVWSKEAINTGAFQSSDWNVAITDFNVSGNMIKIIQAGNTEQYPAAYAALNYTPSAAPATTGKWALPTVGILNSLYTNLNAINNTISKLGGAQLTNNNEQFWSSSECGRNFYTWAFNTNYDGGVACYNKNALQDIRPVLSF